MDGYPVGNGFSDDIAGMTCGEERELLVTLPNARLAPGLYCCSIGIGKGNNLTGWVNYDGILNTLYFDVMAPKTAFGLPAEWHSSWGAISFENLGAAWEEEGLTDTKDLATPR